MQDERTNNSGWLISHDCPCCGFRWNAGWGSTEEYKAAPESKTCMDCVSKGIFPTPTRIETLVAQIVSAYKAPKEKPTTLSKEDQRKLRLALHHLGESDKKHKKEYAEGTMEIIRADKISGFNMLPDSEDILQATYNRVMESDHIQGIDAIQSIFVEVLKTALENKGQTNGDST